MVGFSRAGVVRTLPQSSSQGHRRSQTRDPCLQPPLTPRDFRVIARRDLEREHSPDRAMCDGGAGAPLDSDEANVIETRRSVQRAIADGEASIAGAHLDDDPLFPIAIIRGRREQGLDADPGPLLAHWAPGVTRQTGTIRYRWGINPRFSVHIPSGSVRSTTGSHGEPPMRPPGPSAPLARSRISSAS